ncbi:hypothetical protein EVA_16987 [gut metagenome]|uniref:Uncharacterized protein n=1 Tax=gut metagenome TaxID=749906 RepID=J9FZD1_9ZZZZ
MGFTRVRPQITMATPEMGLIVRPSAPERAAMAPSVGTSMPKVAA